MIRAVIIDDEFQAIQNMLWELAPFSDEIEVIDTFSDPEQAIVFLDKNTVDVVFLDVEMPTIDGFGVLKKIKNKNFHVVFTTAYSEYALKALKEDALDYILKPFDSEDIAKAIAKVQEHQKKQNLSEKIESLLLKVNNNRKIPLNTEGKLIFINPEKIIYIESDRNYTTIHCEKDEKIVLAKSLKELEDLLDAQVFCRIHNSFIINLQKVQAFYKTESYIILENNIKVPVSRGKRSIFLDRI